MDINIVVTLRLVNEIVGKMKINLIEEIKSYLLNSESGNWITDYSVRKALYHLYVGGLIHMLCLNQTASSKVLPREGPVRQTWVLEKPSLHWSVGACSLESRA